MHCNPYSIFSLLLLLQLISISSCCNHSTNNHCDEPSEQRDVPLTYRLHSDLLKYYKKGTRPVIHPNKIINVTMSVFLYQIINLVSFSIYLPFPKTSLSKNYCLKKVFLFLEKNCLQLIIFA